MKYPRYIRLGLVTASLVLCMYIACVTHAQDVATASIVELPVDSTLGREVGVYMRHLEAHYPQNTKFSIFQRIYNKGILDTTRSSIQVHASTMATPQMYLDLGFLDPDTLTGLETRRMKVFGSVGPYWINVSPELTKGGEIGAYPIKTLTVGQEYLLYDMAVGLPPSHSSMIVMGEGKDKAEMRVTMHVRIDPLSEVENENLRKHQDYNAAFKLEK